MARRELPPTRWGTHELRWGAKTFVMAIVNATPDSFSGDGVGADVARAVALAERAAAEGAGIIDIGGESTRPGHTVISVDEEIARVVPIVSALAGRVVLPISIDTSKAAVAEAAIAAGASIVNDVRGLSQDPDLAVVIARHGLPAVIMHDVAPDPGRDLIASVVQELARRLDRAVAAGIAWERIVIDPGFGFGKTWRENLALLDRLDELTVLDRPILVGFSRKSTIDRVLGAPENDRLEGTLAVTALAIARGADIVRVHDVGPNVRAARMSDAVIRGVPVEAQEGPATATATATAFIALGANLGDRLATLRSAAKELGKLGTNLTASSVYETDPVGYLDQPRFLNAVIRIDVTLSPAALLAALHEIETAHARVRSFKNAPRTLDLDIVLFDNLVMESAALTLPHPRMHERGFVLIPLAEIAPDAFHPVLQASASELLAALGPNARFEPIAPLT